MGEGGAGRGADALRMLGGVGNRICQYLLSLLSPNGPACLPLNVYHTHTISNTEGNGAIEYLLIWDGDFFLVTQLHLSHPHKAFTTVQ